MSGLGTRAATESPTYRTGGVGKFLSDTFSITEFKVLIMVRYWYWYLISAMIFPLTMFYWARAMGPDDPEVIRRLMTGTLIFGVSIVTANNIGQQAVQDYFNGRLKLLVMMPMARAAYAFGTILYASITGAVTVVFLLAFMVFTDVEVTISWTLVPLVTPAVLSMAGLTLFIVSFAPSQEAGGIMATMLGIVLVIVSPVYFTMEQAPNVMRWLGHVSPFRYAADGLMKSFSGQSDIWSELAVLIAFTLVTMSLGLWRLRWRET